VRGSSFGWHRSTVLAAQANAAAILAVTALIVFEAVHRLGNPTEVRGGVVMIAALVALAGNGVSVILLRDSHAHAHEDSHVHTQGHAHRHAHADMNMRSAYLHVLADAATSVFAIVALFGGLLWGAVWLDPVMGLAGAVLVSVWAIGLLRDSGRILLDAEMDSPVVAEIREVLERGSVPARITDLHVWRVGREKYAVVVSVTTPSSENSEYFRRALLIHEELAHVTVDVERVPGESHTALS